MGKLIFITSILIGLFSTSITRGQQLYSLILSDSVTVEYSFGSSEIINRNEIISRLDTITFQNIKKIIINGYTDTVGSLTYNEKLAENRLKKAHELLKERITPSLSISFNNLNEKRNQFNIVDSLYRRADILFYRYHLNVPLNKNYPLQVNFPGDSDFILPDSRGLIDQIAFILLQDTTLNIELQGHISGENSNYELSLNRALSVQAYLVNKGVRESRISSKGMDNKYKLYREVSEATMAKNRRVEIILSRE